MGYPSRVSRKGKAGPLEAGRGKYSPGPRKGHFGGIEAKKQRSHVLKFLFPIKSNTYKNICIKTQETPLNHGLERGLMRLKAFLPERVSGLITLFVAMI